MKDRLQQNLVPEVARNGQLISTPVEVAPVIQKAAEANKDWDHSADAATWYRRAGVIMDRFYHGIPRPGFDGRLPAPLIGAESMNIRTLAAYRLVPDGLGLKYRLDFNEQHFVTSTEGKKAWRFGEWALMETLTHELGHHWQQLKGNDPYKRGKITHNKEFTDKLVSLGIYATLGHGAHHRPADLDGPFGILMREWGIIRP